MKDRDFKYESGLDKETRKFLVDNAKKAVDELALEMTPKPKRRKK